MSVNRQEVFKNLGKSFSFAFLPLNIRKRLIRDAEEAERQKQAEIYEQELLSDPSLKMIMEKLNISANRANELKKQVIGGKINGIY